MAESVVVKLLLYWYVALMEEFRDEVCAAKALVAAGTTRLDWDTNEDIDTTALFIACLPLQRDLEACGLAL